MSNKLNPNAASDNAKANRHWDDGSHTTQFVYKTPGNVNWAGD